MVEVHGVVPVGDDRLSVHLEFGGVDGGEVFVGVGLNQVASLVVFVLGIRLSLDDVGVALVVHGHGPGIVVEFGHFRERAVASVDLIDVAGGVVSCSACQSPEGLAAVVVGHLIDGGPCLGVFKLVDDIHLACVEVDGDEPVGLVYESEHAADVAIVSAVAKCAAPQLYQVQTVVVGVYFCNLCQSVAILAIELHIMGGARGVEHGGSIHQHALVLVQIHGLSLRRVVARQRCAHRKGESQQGKAGE